MTTTIHTSIVIAASPQNIWTVLTDFKHFEKWNPFIRSVTGALSQGSKLKIHITPPGSKGMHFSPTIISLINGKRLQWLGTLGFKGLFDGAHLFDITDNGNGTCTFIQEETFSGILVSILKSQLRSTEEGFKLMNEQLKRRAEQLHH